MNDTSTEMTERFHSLLMKRSAEERLLMGCAMFDTAKEIIRSSILEKEPNISSKGLKEAFFLRIYGQEFNSDSKQKILSELEND